MGYSRKRALRGKMAGKGGLNEHSVFHSGQSQLRNGELRLGQGCLNGSGVSMCCQQSTGTELTEL